MKWMWRIGTLLVLVGVYSYLAPKWNLPNPADRRDYQANVSNTFRHAVGQQSETSMKNARADYETTGNDAAFKRALATERARLDGVTEAINNPNAAFKNCAEKTEVTGGFELDLRACPNGQEIPLPLGAEEGLDEHDYTVELVVKTGVGNHELEHVLPDVPIITTAPGVKSSKALYKKTGHDWVLRGNMWYKFRSEAHLLRVVRK